MPRKPSRTRHAREEIEAAIDRYVLNERHRRILRRRLIDHPTIGEMAEEFDRDESTIKRIIRQYKDILSDYM